MPSRSAVQPSDEQESRLIRVSTATSLDEENPIVISANDEEMEQMQLDRLIFEVEYSKNL